MKNYKDYSKFNKEPSFGSFITRNPHHLPWYRVWYNARQRCINPNNSSYKHYGAKGIKFFITINDIKKLWFRDKAYLLKVPSIDRIDTYGNYTLENCRFIEFEENNKRDKRKNLLSF
jgi:hypothetical protein